MELTPARTRRILEAKAETQRKLDKELGYSEDLQHAEIIAEYRQHIAHLEGMLS